MGYPYARRAVGPSLPVGPSGEHMLIGKIISYTASVTITVLVLASLCSAAPHADRDARASLRFNEPSTIRLDPCKISMQRCMIETTSNQIQCFATVAAQQVCAGRPVAAAMQQRAALEEKTLGELSLQRCLDNVDALIGAWLMADDSTHSSAAIDNLTDEQGIVMAVARCGNLIK